MNVTALRSEWCRRLGVHPKTKRCVIEFIKALITYRFFQAIIENPITVPVKVSDKSSLDELVSKAKRAKRDPVTFINYLLESGDPVARAIKDWIVNARIVALTDGATASIVEDIALSRRDLHMRGVVKASVRELTMMRRRDVDSFLKYALDVVEFFNTTKAKTTNANV